MTVLFADVRGSMELSEQLDPEQWHRMIDRFFVLLCEGIHRYEGTVSKFTGDGVMALFGAPLAHEDHARRACRATLDLARDLRDYAAELETEGVEFSVRLGLNSGEVVLDRVGEDLAVDYTAVGHTVGLAQRMEQLARPGTVLVTEHTAALVEGYFELVEIGPTAVKGSSHPIRVFELRGERPARTAIDVARTRGLSRFVGRDREQAALDAALERALRGAGGVVTIVGEPGVGKSRLCHEFLSEHANEELAVYSTAAAPHGRAIPLAAVLSMLREFFGVTDGDDPEVARERIAAVLSELDPSLESERPLLLEFLGVAQPDQPHERLDPEARERRLLSLVTRLVQAQSARAPTILLIEDLHWLDAASDLFLTHLVSAATQTRTLLVATFRPEYRRQWVDAQTHLNLPLDPLDNSATREMLADLLGADPSLDSLVELVTERTAGNPFFVEEIVRGLVDAGHLAGDRGNYSLARSLDELELPANVRVVLSARIDRLRDRDKALVQIMSVVGNEIQDDLLEAVAELASAELADAIEELEATELLRETPSDGHRQYSFKHPLTQAVAYSSQLSEQRVRSHRAVAQAIERLYPDGLDERAALIAHHCEGAEEWLGAARWHARAAAWAAVSAPAEGMRHWQRVRELGDRVEQSPETDALAIASRISIVGLAWRLGLSLDETAKLHAEAIRLMAGAGPSASRRIGGGLVSAERVMLDVAYGGNLFFGGLPLEGLEILREASSNAASIGDPGLILSANAYAAVAAWATGNFQECVDFTARAITRAGDDVDAGAGILVGNPYAYCLWQRGYGQACLGRLEQGWSDYDLSLEIAAKYRDQESEIYALITRALVRSDILEFRVGLSDAERAAELAERIGNNQARVASSEVLATLRWECADFEGARTAAERALALARERGAGLAWEADTLRPLAMALVGLGDIEQARATAEAAVVAAGRTSMRRSTVLSELGFARVLIAIGDEGDVETAEAALQRALAMARETGYLISEPRIQLEQAALARLQGDEERALRAEGQADRILSEIGAQSARPGAWATGTSSDLRSP